MQLRLPINIALSAGLGACASTTVRQSAVIPFPMQPVIASQSGRVDVFAQVSSSQLALARDPSDRQSEWMPSNQLALGVNVKPDADLITSLYFVRGLGPNVALEREPFLQPSDTSWGLGAALATRLSSPESPVEVHAAAKVMALYVPGRIDGTRGAIDSRVCLIAGECVGNVTPGSHVEGAASDSAPILGISSTLAYRWPLARVGLSGFLENRPRNAGTDRSDLSFSLDRVSALAAGMTVFAEIGDRYAIVPGVTGVVGTNGLALAVMPSVGFRAGF
jgi:hypothetical protein